MAEPRARMYVSVGNILELAGATIGCVAVNMLVGPKWALLAGAVCILVGAELIYDASTVRVPLPRRPHPVAKTAKVAKSTRTRLGRLRPHLARRRARLIIDLRLLRRGVWPR